MKRPNKAAVVILFFANCVAALGAEKPRAPAGYRWKSFTEARCEIQVPDGWFEAKRTAGLTHAVLLSPERISEGAGIDIGFTINAVKCKTQAQWQEAMTIAGKMMSDARKATENPIDSRVDDKPDMLLMILEGERFIPDSPHPEKKYHVRAVVRAFPKFATIYMYSFGAPVDVWEAAWKKGTVMLNPVWFTLER